MAKIESRSPWFERLEMSSDETAQAMDTPVLVVGLGEVGRPLLEVLRAGHPAAGRDVEDREFRGVEILHVCFPFGEGFVEDAAAYASRYEPELVIINSTVTPGTSRAVHERTGVPTVYSPVRGKHTRMKDELLRYTKFVAGSSTDAAARAEDHFRRAGMTTGRMSTLEVLEIAKLFETTYFGLLIAWAQEMDRFHESLGTDYWESLRFLEEIDFLPPVGFQPGFIGGHCVMPNLDLLEQVRESPFVDAIRKSNEQRGREWEQIGRSLTERIAPKPNHASESSD
jgi:UDP-N-acetyl-D-mannosaminuronate dehydrogenase